MGRIAERVPEANQESLQNFISDSLWDAQAVMDRVAQQVDEKIGHPEDACLLVDESGFVKKGKKSVGVSRQWLGRLGKVDNGQVGVFTALCKDADASLINARLYLPQEWTTDIKRCKESGVPKECMRFQSKEEIALDMVKHARSIGIRFGYIGADAGYGKGLSFLQQLHSMHEQFMVDVHRDFTMYSQNPKPYIPPTLAGTPGRVTTEYVTDRKPYRIDQWAKQQPDSAWQKVEIRSATKGVLCYEILTAQVWVWDKGTKDAWRWHAVIRRNADTKDDLKYSLSNAPAQTSCHRLAAMQSQRFWVERAFENAKSECGMADYEVRGWRAWHHHMALVLLASSFLLDERVRNRDQHPLLSCADVIDLLCAVLPARESSLEATEQRIRKRHEKRQSAIDSALKRQQESS